MKQKSLKKNKSLKSLKKKGLALALALSSSLVAGVYIVPLDYDNTIASARSNTPVLITNSLTTNSSTTRKINGQTVRYRCEKVPKIDCRGTTASIHATLGEYQLKDNKNNEVVQPYMRDIIVESDGSGNWNICGGAIGGTMWDNADLNTTTDPITGNTKIFLTYQENVNSENFYFFMSGGTIGVDADKSIGSLKSFMAINTKQTCN